MSLAARIALLALVGCAADAPAFRVIAHRGASAYAPENTLPAIERARQQGAREVEIDVQLSRDGAVVLFHDATLDEKTDLGGAVRDHDAAALRRAEIGAWFDATNTVRGASFAGTTLTTLDAVFARFGADLHYHVEMKSREPELPARILALAAQHGLDRQVMLTSFHLPSLQSARAIDREVGITWLLDAPSGAAMEQAADERFSMVGVRAEALTPAVVAAARARGLGIRAWKVRTPETLDRVVALGADGATVDWPDVALERLRRR